MYINSSGWGRIKDICPGSQGSNARPELYANGMLYLSAAGCVGGYELWISDGTAEGTKLVRDINPTGDANPHQFTFYNGLVYFSATDGVHGYELWRTDGTYTGTIQMADINPVGDSYPSQMVVFKDKLFFRAMDEAHGSELWATDGSEAGTQLVSDINPGPSHSDPYWLTLMGENLYFSARSNSAQGDERELWKSDGTPAGTVMVADINPNGGSYPDNLVKAGSRIYFVANDGMHEYELWASDGTAAGTQLVADINPNGSGLPLIWGEFVYLNCKLYFMATDGVHGYELWVEPVLECGQAFLPLVLGK